MPAFAARYRLPALMTAAAFFIAAPMPAQAQPIDIAGILDRSPDLDTRMTLHTTRIAANAGAIVARVDAQDARLADVYVAPTNNNVRIGANTAAIANLDAQDGALPDLDVRRETVSCMPS